MLMSTASAAQHLGLTRRRVTELVRTGSLDAQQIDGDRWMIDSQAVAQYRLNGAVNGRPWDSDVAWNLIEVLSSAAAASERVTRRIRENSAEKIAAQISRLIDVERYQARALKENTDLLIVTAESAADRIGLNLVGTSPVVHAYCGVDNWEQLLDAVPYSEGNLAVYSWRDGENRVQKTALTALIAIDCSRSANARVRAAGITYLGNQRDKWLAKNII